MLRSVVLGMLADPGTVDNLYARVCAHRAGQDLLDFDPLAAPPSGCPLPATVLYVHHEPDSRSGPWTGATSTTNGHVPCRRHHRVKTSTDWRVATITTGVWLWTSPTSKHYLVTPGTTTPLR